ncbi:type II toxin-antitoxin system RelE/ParE family toxin [Parapedobacter tibetensis]|uniref:type II toxin-antitoxin system RelE/ParE family toxin n=1 Tax=Parapedobacter tibetensis TaxID=2972951 RepID=UPI00214D40E0|nr:hypothetical protein [Parapedobacter tibetensis]
MKRCTRNLLPETINLNLPSPRTLARLEQDAYDQALKTHKLSGNLAAYLACSCGYDCRIVFSIEKAIDDPAAEVILLHDIGTHDDVY